MTWAFVQDKAGFDDTGGGFGSGGAVLAFDSPVQVGNLIIVSFAWSTTKTESVADNLGNAYTPCGAQHHDATNDQHQRTYSAVVTTGGACTVTVTYVGGNPGFRRMLISELSGNHATSPFDDSTGVAALSTVATDGISSGNITPSVPGALIYGFAQNTDEVDPGTGVMSAGTGFSALEGDDATPEIFMGEWKEQAVAAAVAATFTPTVAHRTLTSVVSFKPLVVVGAPGSLQRNLRSHVAAQVRMAER